MTKRPKRNSRARGGRLRLHVQGAKEIINSDPQLEVVGAATRRPRSGRARRIAASQRDHDGHQYAPCGRPASDRADHVAESLPDCGREFRIPRGRFRLSRARTRRNRLVPKPSSGIDLDMRNVREDLTRKLKLAAKVRVVRTATLCKLPAPHAPLPAPAGAPGGGIRGTQTAERFRWS